MSFLGRVEGRCPDGCEPSEFEVWSFVRGDRDEDLRLSLLSGELNLVLCQSCGKPFFPEASLVYVDSAAAMVAFVFPEAWEREAERWREKMRADFAQMREAMGGELPLAEEPEVYFGYAAMRDALQGDDDREDEARVAEYLLGGLGLTAWRVDPAYARRRGLPRFVPLKGPRWSPEAARAGVDALLEANDRLVSFAGWRAVLDAGEKPPAARGPRRPS